MSVMIHAINKNGERAILYKKIRECFTRRPLSKDLKQVWKQSHVSIWGECSWAEGTLSAKDLKKKHTYAQVS